MEIELRKFGFMMAGILSLLFGLTLPLIFSKPIPLYLWVIGLFFFMLASMKPRWLGPVYHLWMKIGHVLGWINTRIILGIIFFGLITPLGLMMRAFRQDPMLRSYDPTLTSYRKNIPSRSIDHMERPF
jgi:hypothetical protein